MTLEEAQGVGGGVEVVYDWKVLSFVANRVQVLYKADSETLLGLTNAEEATSRAADAVDLYTCIPHADGLKAVCFFLSCRRNRTPFTDTRS
eukprot:g16255.t1